MRDLDLRHDGSGPEDVHVPDVDVGGEETIDRPDLHRRPRRVSDELGRCYWFPVEAFGDDASQGLANDEVASALRRMRAKHVMVVADSCFTAAQRREVGLQDESANAHERLSKLRTRVVLTSGGLEPIQDGQGSGHSVFTGALLAALQKGDAGVLRRVPGVGAKLADKMIVDLRDRAAELSLSDAARQALALGFFLLALER